ncbi:LysR family transcriptional regulator [Alkalicoccobacillus porphyridii]|uniref:LysR family transcriptional regulator n=1 Tax=Alkalicoccobacillus porphyridii TaxID=2597270 RepID=A0A554A195_9BACI|nr:LysR family transcriptional regulator [Alkalicoccobacillus porphyridii]TSB47468.1 LysR family transcriptional regulator [Alkalicoccobacillus porphyridii]
MNLHGLRLFYHVVQEGSITRAAEVLHISQPAVSSQLKVFEAEMGVSLFTKEGRKLQVTPFGMKLAEKSKTLFAVEHHIESFIDDYHHARTGHIHIAATYLPANFMLPKWAGAFKAKFPEVDLTIETSNSNDAFLQLAEYKADIAMYAGSPEQRPEQIIWDEMFEDDLWFVVSPSHRLANKTVSLDEVAAEPFVMREEGSSTRSRLYAICQANEVRPPQIALQFTGLHEALSAVMAGFGVNFVSSFAAKEYASRGRLARVFVPGISAINKIAICTRKNEPQSELVEAFIEHCKEIK